jgi:hypothetical protein
MTGGGQVAEHAVAQGGPEELLRGALEKIVFFECRVSQLDAEVAAARAVASREKEAAVAARTRELELETLLAQARSAVATMKSRSIELEEHVKLLETERQRFLSSLVERARVAGAPSDIGGNAPGEQADLAGFIAELRDEIERLKVWKTAAEKAGITVEPGTASEPSGPVPPVSTLAGRFEEAGRLSFAASETDRMKEQLATRAERSLYTASMEDLSTADPGRRKRAAECLRALGSPAAAPLVAAAIGREADPAVKAALLTTLAATGEPSAAAIALREVSDSRPEVRAAALEAAAALAKEKAEPAIIKALADPSALVRRRAVLLLGFIPGATVADALAAMLSDQDTGVARTAALALSGRPEVRAQAALTKALDHREPAIRRCAADAIARWSGETIDPASPAVERRRTARRIAETLARMEENALREAMAASPATAATINQPQVIIPKPMTEEPSPAEPERPVALKSVPAARPVESPVEAPKNKPSPLEAVLIGEIRTSLRGRTAEELSQLANTGITAVTDSLALLVRQGTLSQRGPRFFVG